MKDIGERLRENDPVRREPALPADEVGRLRRTVLDVAARADLAPAAPATPATFWPRPVFVTVTVAVTLIASVLVGRRLPVATGSGSRARGALQGAAVASPTVERRQLQFSTPGGTRIIWVFDPNFSL